MVSHFLSLPGVYEIGYPPFIFVDSNESNTAWNVAPFKVRSLPCSATTNDIGLRGLAAEQRQSIENFELN
jgi:hypothetical protein